MKKDDLWHFRNEIKKVARALSIIKKRLNEGRYEEAADSMRREGVMLSNMYRELSDIIEQQDSNV
ncbi:hypothetical protein MC118_001680 [Salmonella enterica]|nr:hypothetical protein [Salmonella enterica]